MSISKERVKEIKAIRDEDIDYSDIPELDENFFQKAQLVTPKGIDQDVLGWFKRSYGKDYLSKISAVLRQFMETHL